MFFSKIIFTPFIFGCCSSYNRADDLCSARILDLLDLADNGLVYACANDSRSKAGTCNPAHDAADDGMDGDFPAAAVVGEVMGKAEGFFTEGGKFLLFFDLLFIEDVLYCMLSLPKNLLFCYKAIAFLLQKVPE
ncbi:hypothetical protein QCO44_05350 [Selenomonas sputigena]|uniref:Uncharacterized protein n=1 Tax=Selenomonas sputigena TaxID=69823 RepID=A0ABV3X4E4_9FIRM